MVSLFSRPKLQSLQPQACKSDGAKDYLVQKINDDFVPCNSKMEGFAAWLPTKEQTEDFYKCHCGDPKWIYPCYSPHHRNEGNS